MPPSRALGMAAAGGGEEQRHHGEQASASSTRVEVNDSPGASSGAGHSAAAAHLIGALRRSQEELATMGKADVLAYEERLQALRLRVLQRIQEEEEKAVAAEQLATEPRRVG